MFGRWSFVWVSGLTLSMVCLVSPSHTAAQSFSATLTGQIIDSSGAAVPGVAVTVTVVATNRSHVARTSAEGLYVVPNLVPGSYRLTAEATGFKQVQRSGITLEVDQVARLDLTLEVGVVTEVIEVTSQAPLINTETGAKGQVITTAEINDLPLNGRDFSELAFLTPGVVDIAEGGANAGFAAINGGRADGVNFVVDGMNNRSNRAGDPIVRPSVDAVLEFKVQTSAYAADYGAVGSGVINVALRGGTNQFHGTAYEFVRNDIFDARGFFDQDKSKLRRNQFGGTLGGPVKLPSRIFGPAAYSGKDRTFFFFSYEGLRERRGNTLIGSVPPEAYRRGDFSASPVAIRNPFANNAPFANKQIPASMFHPLASKLMQFYPLPNRAGGNNFVASLVDESNSNNFIAKLDQRVGSRNTLALHYITGPNKGANPYGLSAVPGFGNTNANGSHQAAIRLTSILSPVVVNELRLGFARSKSYSNWRSDDPALLELAKALSGVSSEKIAGVPRTTVTGYDQLGHLAAQPVELTVNTYQVYDAVSVTKGRHFVRAGADIVRTQFFQLFNNNARGTMTFNGIWTQQSASLREPVADLLLGLLNTSNRLLNSKTNYLFSTTYGLFVQDDFRVAPKLTLNLGLRYDLLMPPVEKFNQFTNFIPSVGRIVMSGEAGFPRALVENHYLNFAPRFGFAWRPLKSNKLVLRGGFGVFYANSTQNALRQLLAKNYPYSVVENYSRVTTNPLALTLSNPFPANIASASAGTSTAGVQFDAPASYLQQYNLTIERALGRGIAFEIGYVGSVGHHLSRRYDLNQPDRSLPGAPRPFPVFTGGIQYVGFGSNSNYNGLQTTLRKNFSNGMGFRANFVWSKSLDDASAVMGAGVPGLGDPGGAQDSRNLRLERGMSGYNRPRVFTLDYSYLLPFGKGRRWLNRSGPANWLLGGWQTNGIVRLMDGQPFSVTVANYNYLAGEASRPDRLGSGKLDNPSVERWFNVADFQAVPTGAFRFGTSGRNILLGPGRKQVDLSLMKNFVFSEQRRLQLRWEVFNAPNTANFGLPVHDIDVPNAATLSRVNAGRVMQLALKYLF